MDHSVWYRATSHAAERLIAIQEDFDGGRI